VIHGWHTALTYQLTTDCPYNGCCDCVVVEHYGSSLCCTVKSSTLATRTACLIHPCMHAGHVKLHNAHGPELKLHSCCCCCRCCCRHLGGSGSNGNTAVDVDYGGASFEISQLDGVLEI
jgi:hypothetical protein